MLFIDLEKTNKGKRENLQKKLKSIAVEVLSQLKTTNVRHIALQRQAGLYFLNAKSPKERIDPSTSIVLDKTINHSAIRPLCFHIL